MGSATIRCCSKRWELEFGWTNRLGLIVVPYFVIGFVLNTFITAPHWWGNGNEALIVAVNLILLIVPLFALMEISREPTTRWSILVFLAEAGALVASIIFLVITFEELKTHSQSSGGGNEDDTAVSSTSEPPKSDEDSPDSSPGLKHARRSWIRWEECIALIVLSLVLLANSSFSRLIKLAKTQAAPDNCEESHNLQAAAAAEQPHAANA